MAIYHLNSKVVSRSKGQTAANALAYEAGIKLTSIEGREVDFSSKVVLANYVIGTTDNLQTLADKMEFAENRKNSTVARRMTIALPDELTPGERNQAAKEFGEFMHESYGLAVVVSVHAPDSGGDQRNHHAHLTMSDRRLDEEGNFGEKARELTARENGQAKKELAKIREKWADVANAALERAGHAERIDHRSNEERKILEKPTEHLGKAKTEISRKTGYYITKAGANELIQENNEPILTQTAGQSNEENGELQPRGDEGDAERMGRNVEDPRKREIQNQEARGRSGDSEGTHETVRRRLIQEHRAIVEHNKRAIIRGGGDFTKRSPAVKRKLTTEVSLEVFKRRKTSLERMREKLIKPMLDKIPEEVRKKDSRRYWSFNIVNRIVRWARNLKEGKVDISESYEHPEKKQSRGQDLGR